MPAVRMGWEVSGSPYGAPAHRKVPGARPEGGADRMSAPDLRGRMPRRSAPGPGTADGRGEPDKDDGPVDRRPGERAHRDCAPRAFPRSGMRSGKVRAIRGVLLFGYFLLDKQEKVALGG